MQLIEVPAKTGYVWFRQGIWLFRRNPLAFLTLCFAFWLMIMLIESIPVIGNILPLLFVPGVAVGFTAACRDTIAGKPVFPTILVDGFRSYGGTVAKRLLVLGVIYAVAIALVLAASALVDGGDLLRLITLGGTLDVQTLENNSNLPLALLTWFVCAVAVSVLFWFAAVLTAWQDASPAKALFFSIVTCWRNKGAFAVYGLLWFALTAGVFILLINLLLALSGDLVMVSMLMTPVPIVLMTMFYCSFYATYRGCYGVQEKQAAEMPDSGR